MAPDATDLDAFDRSRQHRRGVTHAGTELENALASPAGLTDTWVAEVRERLAAITTAFQRHVDQSEGTTGLLQEMLTVAPHLAPGVTRSKKDHQEILVELKGLSTVIDQSDDEHLVGDVRARGLVLLQHITAHRQRGADLIYDAYSVDVEGGG
jgi:hypothetical protein